jgi:hypothetical protein
MTWFGRKIQPDEYSSYMYWNNYIGKLTGEADIVKEISDRTTASKGKMSYDPELRAWSREKFESDLVQELDRVARESMTNKKISKTFGEFIDEGYLWVAPGSVAGFSTVGEEHKVALGEIYRVWSKELYSQQIRLNKRGLFENRAAIEKLAKVIENGGDSTTRVATKHEIKALRALFPANIAHYIVFSYFLNVAEKLEVPTDMMFSTGDATDVMNLLAWSNLYSDSAKLMYDFKNFNIQHDVSDMAQTIGVIAKYISKYHESNDFRAAAVWLIESLNNMWFIADKAIPEKNMLRGEMIKFTRGLLSGWRGTTWINTILNKAYVRVAHVNYKRLYGTDCIIKYVGSGDDVALAGTSNFALSRLYNVMGQMNLEATASKQLLGDQAAEFLRNTYVSGMCYGSVHRVLSQMISGNWLGTGSDDVYTRMQGIRDTIVLCMRRGVHPRMAQSLWEASKRRWANLETDAGLVAISDEVIFGTKESGGLGIASLDGKRCVLKGGRIVQKTVSLPFIGKSDMSKKQAQRLTEDLALVNVQPIPLDQLTRQLAEDSYKSSIRAAGGREMRTVEYTPHTAASWEQVGGEADNLALLRDYTEWLLTKPGDKLLSVQRNYNRLKVATRDREGLAKRLLVREGLNMAWYEIVMKDYQFSGAITYMVPDSLVSSIRQYSFVTAANRGELRRANYIANSVAMTLKRFSPGLMRH